MRPAAGVALKSRLVGLEPPIATHVEIIELFRNSRALSNAIPEFPAYVPSTKGVPHGDHDL